MSLLVVVKVHNVNFALDLMDDAGLPKAKARAEGKNANTHCFYSTVTATIFVMYPVFKCNDEHRFSLGPKGGPDYFALLASVWVTLI